MCSTSQARFFRAHALGTHLATYDVTVFVENSQYFFNLVFSVSTPHFYKYHFRQESRRLRNFIACFEVF